MFSVLPLFLVLLTGCGNKSTAAPDPAPTEEPAPAPDPEPAPEPAPEPEAEVTPASLYAECEGRVEGKTAEGECEKDEDCGTAGCGNEVCVTTLNAKDVMSTCDNKRCYDVLDTCGCHEGQCTWTLTEEVPEAKDIKGPKTELPKTKLPTKLPPTNPPAEGGE